MGTIISKQNSKSLQEKLEDTESPFQQLGLRTSTVIRNILEQFTDSELLELSLVNKQWNFEGRSLLRGRGSISAKIVSHDPRKSLADLALCVQQMRSVPFSGLTFLVSNDRSVQSSFQESLDPSYNVILNRLPCKHLSVRFVGSLVDFEDSQAIVLVQKVLDVFHGVLEELSIDLVRPVAQEIFQQIFQHCDFPLLKTLKIKGDSFDDESLTSFLRSLVPRAPKLQEINFDGGIYFEQNVLEGSSAVLVPTMEFNPLYGEVCESLIGSVRAETIEIRNNGYLDLNVELLLKRAVPMALQASRSALKTLRMDLLFAVPLMCYGICLENVTALEIRMRRDSLARISSTVLNLLKRFDFTRTLPKVEQVVIVIDSMNAFKTDQVLCFVEEMNNGALKENFPDRAVGIKQLALSDFTWKSAIPFWAQMFPQVKTLSVDTGAESLDRFPFTLLWKHFVNLEELTLISCHFAFMMTTKLDSAFCGIFPEEVDELIEKDDEYLRAVNLVPVMPSVTGLSGLRTIKLDFKIPYYMLEVRPGATFLFSKVTTLTAFARCPRLGVTFKQHFSKKREIGFSRVANISAERSCLRLMLSFVYANI